MIKEDLLYTETHEWVKVEDGEALIGITDYAQNELGDIVYVELPEIGDDLIKNDALGTIEAVKAVEDIVAPISGEIIDVNEELEDTPELINQSAFEDGWIIRIKISDDSELEALLSAKEYQEIVE